MKQLVMAALLLSLAVAGCDSTTVYDRCEELGGESLEEFSECVGINQTACEELGGEFQECESACRNDPNAEICTMQCVQVCQFQ